MFTLHVVLHNTLRLLVPRRAIALLAAPVALACDQSEPTGSTRNLADVAPRVSIAPDAALAQADETPPTAQGTIPLPINQMFSSAGGAFRLNQTGTGHNGNFTISNPNSASSALHAQSNGAGFAVRAIMSGSGQAGQFHTTNVFNAAPTLEAKQFGVGSAATFAIDNVDNQSSTVGISSNSNFQVPTLSVTNTGEGFAAYLESRADIVSASTLVVKQLGTGSAATFIASNSRPSTTAALQAISDRGTAGSFLMTNGPGGSAAIYASSLCNDCPAGVFEVNNTSHILPAIFITTNGEVDSWAASFNHTGSGGGVQITTNGGPGLQVVGGSKNAVVRTRDGSRALYTEESTEVWFTDYGFGRLANARVRVRLDPKFSETVALGEPYHVFVQPYGRAEIYVTNRDRSGFDVVLKDGEPNVEFSYRVVAKRLGFESKRLERAPWADRAVVAGRDARRPRAIVSTSNARRP